MLLEMIERKARLSAQWKSLRDAYGAVAQEQKQLENGLVLDINIKRERGFPQSPVDEFRRQLECYTPPRVVLCAVHPNARLQLITYGD